ncbi:integumentary mucin A.1-like [Lucilia cuprina]|uniref:integumentary mucin A.1-like n=1 Tax=Lucilia cuprina TaxID=7375 RepID=UPI001F060B6F|nr:integumentary mucin A.1-like [Lucilia cuprina]
MFRIVLYSLLLTQLLSSLTQAAIYPECENVAAGIYIAVASNCSKAIYCNGEDSSIVECDFSRPYFSSTDQNCYSESSICGDRPFGGEIEDTPTTPAIPSTATTGLSTLTSTLTAPTTVTVTSTPSTATFPISTLATTVVTIPTTIVIPTTWPPRVTTSTSSTRITSTSTDPSIFLTCPPVDDPSRPLFLPHPKSCSQYYLCYHGEATVMQCPNMLHFDVTQQSCNTAEKVNCQISAVVPRDQCLPQTVDVYPHATNCNYYYLCEYGYLMVMQCPFNMGWDYETRACTVKSKAKCYNEALVI